MVTRVLGLGLKANGGYTDLQLLGFGVAIIVIPVALVALLVYAAVR